MKTAATMPSRLAATMNANLFKVDQDGVLVYMDPLVGRLENRTHDLVVRLDAEAEALVLHRGAVAVAEFEIAENPVEACREAFGAYFAEFDRCCRGLEPRRAVAA